MGLVSYCKIKAPRVEDTRGGSPSLSDVGKELFGDARFAFLILLAYFCGMRKTIPQEILRISESLGLPDISLVVENNAALGDVYGFSPEEGSPTLPTGLPVMYAYKAGDCRPLSPKECFNLLDSLGE